jgi:pimeloyl-ACP methyl ester carboxylesterase
MAESLVVETSWGKIAVRCSGEGAPPVVLLHGIPGSGRTWTQVGELLGSRHRIVVPDLVGFGGSARCRDVEALHAEGQATALAEVLSRVGVRRAVLVGHDFGGPVALTLARRSPDLVAALGLLATNTFGDTPIPFPLSVVTWPGVGSTAARALFSGPALRLMMRRGVGRPAPEIDLEAAVGDRHQRRAIRLVFEASLTRLVDLYRPIQEGLGNIDVPTLVGWGERDPFFSVDQGRRTAAAVPGARFRLYGGAGHFLPEERPHEVASDVAQLTRAAMAQA